MSRPQQLEASVAQLRRLDYPRYEILIVDNRPAGAPRETSRGAGHPRGAPRDLGRPQRWSRDGARSRSSPSPMMMSKPTRAGSARSLSASLRSPALTGVSGLVVPCELETARADLVRGVRAWPGQAVLGSQLLSGRSVQRPQNRQEIQAMSASTRCMPQVSSGSGRIWPSEPTT